MPALTLEGPTNTEAGRRWVAWRAATYVGTVDEDTAFRYTVTTAAGVQHGPYLTLGNASFALDIFTED